MRAALLLACSLLLAAVGSQAAAPSAPLLVWSSSDVLSHGKGARVSYEVVLDAAELASKVVSAAAGKAVSGIESLLASPSNLGQGAVVVFVGSQLDTIDLRQGSGLPKLSAALERAESSLAAPYTLFQGKCLYGAIASQLKAAGVAYQSISCKDSTDDVAGAISKALDAPAQEGVRVLLVSSHVDEALDQTPEGLDAELEQLMTVQEALDATGLNSVFVYAARAHPAAERRALQEGAAATPAAPVQRYKGFGPYQQCGPLCQVQVRWLEGMLALLFMALAACSGMTCLYLLDTPTKFEASKEGAAQQ